MPMVGIGTGKVQWPKSRGCLLLLVSVQRIPSTSGGSVRTETAIGSLVPTTVPEQMNRDAEHASVQIGRFERVFIAMATRCCFGLFATNCNSSPKWMQIVPVNSPPF